MQHNHVDEDTRQEKGHFTDLDVNFPSVHCVPCMHFTSVDKAPSHMDSFKVVIRMERLINVFALNESLSVI